MDATTFVHAVRDTMTSLKNDYFSDESETQVALQIADMGLTPSQKTQLELVVAGVITDAAYTLLLGIDGAASLGQQQQEFQLIDENGNRVGDGGDIEAAAFEIFQEKSILA